MNSNTEYWKDTTTNKHWAGAAMLSVSYLCGEPKIWKYIQEKCKYYLFIEPSQDTHLDSNSDLYKHVDYIAELDKMKVLERINRVNHDQYEAALMVRNET